MYFKADEKMKENSTEGRKEEKGAKKKKNTATRKPIISQT
jgi:hypothetical protein